MAVRPVDQMSINQGQALGSLTRWQPSLPSVPRGPRFPVHQPPLAQHLCQLPTSGIPVGNPWVSFYLGASCSAAMTSPHLTRVCQRVRQGVCGNTCIIKVSVLGSGGDLLTAPQDPPFWPHTPLSPNLTPPETVRDVPRCPWCSGNNQAPQQPPRLPC